MINWHLFQGYIWIWQYYEFLKSPNTILPNNPWWKAKSTSWYKTALLGKIPPLLVLDHWPNYQMTMVPRRQVTTGHTVDASSIIRSVAWKTGLVKRTTKMINWLGPRFKRSEIVWFILYPPILVASPSTCVSDLDHFVSELSVTKTSASQCVGIQISTL